MGFQVTLFQHAWESLTNKQNAPTRFKWRRRFWLQISVVWSMLRFTEWRRSASRLRVHIVCAGNIQVLRCTMHNLQAIAPNSDSIQGCFPICRLVQLCNGQVVQPLGQPVCAPVDNCVVRILRFCGQFFLVDTYPESVEFRALATCRDHW